MPLYDRLFPWARLFLKRAAPATWRDNNPALALLFPMEKIFEDYVAHLVKRAAPAGWAVRAQEQPHNLIEQNPDGESEFLLRPDIVARLRDKTCIRVMDTKWKRVDTQQDHCGISQTDLYQLYAYGKKYQTEGAAVGLYLLYPANKHFKNQMAYCYETALPLTAFPVHLALDDDAAIERNANKPPNPPPQTESGEPTP